LVEFFLTVFDGASQDRINSLIEKLIQQSFEHSEKLEKEYLYSLEYQELEALVAGIESDLRQTRNELDNSPSEVAKNTLEVKRILLFQDLDKVMDEMGRRNKMPNRPNEDYFTQETIDRVKRINLAYYLQSRGLDLKKGGTIYKALCPFHLERTPSFTVFPDNSWKCFGCLESGDIITFVMKSDNKRFFEAVRELLPLV